MKAILLPFLLVVVVVVPAEGGASASLVGTVKGPGLGGNPMPSYRPA